MMKIFLKFTRLAGVLFLVGSVSAQPLPPRLKLNFKRGVTENVLNGDKSNDASARKCERAAQVFDLFPPTSYQIDTSKLGYLAIGELLPDEILDLPLVVTHNFYGRDTVSLRKYSQKEYIVLNFWDRTNAPGMTTMIQWEDLLYSVIKKTTVLGIYLGYDHEALEEMRDRRWHHPQVVSEGAHVLNRYFCRQPGAAGLSAWIRNGRFMGFVKGGQMPDHFVQKIKTERFDSLPSDVSTTITHQGPSKRLLLQIRQAVKQVFDKETTVRLRATQCEAIQQRYLEFPLIKREIDTSYLGYIVAGEKIPDEMLDLPLLAISREKGRDTLTLREYSKTRFLVLDFWARWCSPCIVSMQKWEDLREEIQPYVTVLGVNVDDDVYAVEEARFRNWDNHQIIGNTAYILNRYFCRIPYTVGPSAWIHDGRFIGLTNPKAVTKELLDEMIKTDTTALPDSVPSGFPAAAPLVK